MIEVLITSALRSIVLAAIVWLGLKALRLRNPHIQLTAWTFVLVASLLMPASTRLAAVVVPPAPVIEPAVEDVLPRLIEQRDFAASPAQMAGRTQSIDSRPAASPAADFGERLAFFASLVYAAVAGVFLLRIVAGLLLTLRLSRRAQKLRQSVAGHDIRVSPDISSPATFGRIVLLPKDYADWTGPKRLAVLAHEIAHARRGDFYVQIAAMVNRAIFWFSPLSWWLQCRLSELAEAASDDAALAYLDDRSLYAEILLEFSGGAPTHLAVAMARPATVQARIERILAESALPKLLSMRARAILLTAMAPIAVAAASPLAARSPPAEAALASHLGAPIDADGATRPDEASTPMVATPALEAVAPAPPGDAAAKFPIAALPQSQDTGETKAAPPASSDRRPSPADISLPKPSVAAAPNAPQSEEDHNAARISPQIGAKFPGAAASKVDPVSNEPSRIRPAEAQPAQTTARAMPNKPNICADRHSNADFDPSGQKAFYICPAFDREYAAIQPAGRR